MQWADFVAYERVFNAVLAVVDLAGLFWSVRGWKRRPAASRFHWGAVVLLLIAIGYGSLDGFSLTDTYSSIRTVLVSIALLYLLCSIYIYNKERREGTLPPSS